MQTRFDQAMKEMLQKLLEPCGTFTQAVEVSPDPQVADGYFVPDPKKPSPIADTLLGRMTSMRCAFEFFSTTPTKDDVCECVRKHLNMRHILSTKKPDEPLPHQWIVSAGLPKEAVKVGRGRRVSHWPNGVIGLPDMLATSIIVVNNLPEIPSTLLLRLMGRGRTLRRAVAELWELPENEFQRCATLPVLLRYRVEASGGPVLPEEEEYLVNAQEIVEYMMQKHAAPLIEQQQQQLKKQHLEHERALVLRLLTRRFGTVPAHIAQRIEAADLATLDKYAEKLVVVPSIEDVIDDE